ncbi:SSI family serine proteinase inhibitor [Dactylosporangium sp. NPDC051485]|uniref:SSI family serine proteinase inhibitor n=1 Tax=Dactylosporangium sp. NPDC051485 TaxID=3154846 RepID=UPI003422139F
MGATRVMATAVALLAAVGAAGAVTGTAQAAVTGPAVAQAGAVYRGGGAAQAGARPGTSLVLTVAKGEPARPVQRRAVLTCQPAGGSHRQARDACAQLSKVGGRFERLQLDGGACTMQYDPVTVTASGSWKGRKVAYRHTFGNACTLATTTGAVFSL